MKPALLNFSAKEPIGIFLMLRRAFGLCLVVFALLHRGYSQPVSIYTLVGDPAAGSADGSGRNARFKHPTGIATDPAGNLYVADTQNHTIRKITPEGLVSTIAGLAGAFGSANGSGTNARFYGPQGIAVDNAGFLYVADTANSIIRKISPAGAVTTLAGSAGNHNSFDGAGTNANFNHPQNLAVDNSGNVYVADTWSHTIRKITPAGIVSTLAGLARNPGSVDGTNSKARFNWPAGLAIDAATNIFVADFLNHTIRRISPSGTVSTIGGVAGVWGSASGTNNAARFYHPSGIASLGLGNFLVIDSGNHLLRKISSSGTNWVTTTVAGLTGNAGHTDGTGNASRLNFPSGIARDPAGYIYFTELGNNGIRTDRVVPPILEYTVHAPQIVLSWPASASSFVLETSSVLSSGAAWTPLTNGVVVQGNKLVLTNQLSQAAAFYRLQKP